jgi:predicted ArsR family transcriptional regulator
MKSIGKLNASASSKLLYLYLLEKGDGAYAQQSIADDLGITSRTIKNSLEQLRFLDVLHTKPAKTTGEYSKLFYTLNKEQNFSLTKNTFIDNLEIGNINEETL